MPYIYMLRCRDGSLYTGIAMDLERRMGGTFSAEKSRCEIYKESQTCVAGNGVGDRELVRRGEAGIPDQKAQKVRKGGTYPLSGTGQ